MANRTLRSPSQPTGLFDYLFATMADSKRTRVKDLLRSGRVHVNGLSTTRHDVLVNPNDVIEIRSVVAVAPTKLPLEVLYEDGSILVVNKPSGLLSVGNKHERKRTVEAIVNKALADKGQHCLIVHRLDLYTSGVLLLAKTKAAQLSIQGNWGETEKIYHAIVEGRPDPSQGTLNHFLIEDERLVVHASHQAQRNAIKATLSYETLTYRGLHALIRVQLKTGKKNQIRVQMTAIGHPIAGDAKYGAKTNPLDRLCLHASSLKLRHPESNELLTFSAPLPKGMEPFTD
jgi:23S rRNA pseudouridine1911/1915/1917 synthase